MRFTPEPRVLTVDNEALDLCCERCGVGVNPCVNSLRVSLVDIFCPNCRSRLFPEAWEAV